MTFMDDYREGWTDGRDIRKYIREWEALMQIHVWEYLGMTFDEYNQWADTGQLPERGAP